MRTTLTLDADVARTLEALVRRRKTTLKETVNDLLRAGLGLRNGRTPARFLVKSPSNQSKNTSRTYGATDLATELDDEAVLASMLRR